MGRCFIIFETCLLTCLWTYWSSKSANWFVCHLLFKGTLVFYNIYRFHTDPDYWGDPDAFRPERFIDPSTGNLIRKDRFVPYGFGKRICMGESLARSELFLFTSILIKNVVIEKPEFNSLPDPRNDIAGLTRSPQPFYVKIRRRL